MTSILIAGVGGQGTLLASVILGRVAMQENRDVKLSEVHGMAQRGGSVVTYVRIGGTDEQIYSPLIEKGEADILLAFEQMEAVRWLSYVKPDLGKVYVNTQRVSPMPVITGEEQYPEDLVQYIQSRFPDAVMLDALTLAERAGSIRTVNTVLVGAMATGMEFAKPVWLDVIRNTVKPTFREVNERAFELGYSSVGGKSEG